MIFFFLILILELCRVFYTRQVDLYFFQIKIKIGAHIRTFYSIVTYYVSWIENPYLRGYPYSERYFFSYFTIKTFASRFAFRSFILANFFHHAGRITNGIRHCLHGKIQVVRCKFFCFINQHARKHVYIDPVKM